MYILRNSNSDSLKTHSTRPYYVIWGDLMGKLENTALFIDKIHILGTIAK